MLCGYNIGLENVCVLTLPFRAKSKWLIAIWTEALDNFLPGLVESATVADGFIDLGVVVVCEVPEKVGIREGEAERPLGLVLVTSGEVFRFGELTWPTGLPNARVTVSFSLGGVRGVAETVVLLSGRDVTDEERTLVLLLAFAAIWGFALGVNDLDLWASPAVLKEGVVEVVVLILEGVEVGDGVLRDEGVKDRETVLFGEETEAEAWICVVVVFLGTEEDLIVGMLEGRIVEPLLVGLEDGSLSLLKGTLVVVMDWSLEVVFLASRTNLERSPNGTSAMV